MASSNNTEEIRVIYAEQGGIGNLSLNVRIKNGSALSLFTSVSPVKRLSIPQSVVQDILNEVTSSGARLPIEEAMDEGNDTRILLVGPGVLAYTISGVDETMGGTAYLIMESSGIPQRMVFDLCQPITFMTEPSVARLKAFFTFPTEYR